MTMKLQAGDWITKPDKASPFEKLDITAVYYVNDKKIKGLERKNLFDFVKSNCKCIFAYEMDDVYLKNWENKIKLNVNNVIGILAWR